MCATTISYDDYHIQKRTSSQYNMCYSIICVPACISNMKYKFFFSSSSFMASNKPQRKITKKIDKKKKRTMRTTTNTYTPAHNKNQLIFLSRSCLLNLCSWPTDVR